MPVFIDQLNRAVKIKEAPLRIISLVPSQTELLYDLGLTDEVVGITKFCVHPKSWFRTKTRIGGTKNLAIEKIRGLQPDLVIANKEENVKEQVEIIAREFPVWTSDVNTLEDAYAMIESIGVLVSKKEAAAHLMERIQKDFSSLSLQITDRPRTAYLIWKEPYMTVGGDTFISDLLDRAGFTNVFKNKRRYPEVTIDDLQMAGCRFLFLSSEPYPFQQKHHDELGALLPQTKIVLVDGEIFSWYGSRLLQAPSYFRALHQQLAAIV